MLTVIVPVYNEAQTVEELLRRVQCAPYSDKQVIVVDDGSTDRTAKLLSRWGKEPGFVLLRHEKNRGKGSAIRTALPHALGDFTIIQDADLEYDPADYPLLIEPLLAGESLVVYGSRYLSAAGANRWSRFRLAVLLLNKVVWLFFGCRLTDLMTCYKAFRTDVLRGLELKSRRFEFCVEVTAKLCRLGVPVLEVPISYSPRSRQAGKKIGWRDVGPIIWSLLIWRFRRISPSQTAASINANR